MTPILSYQFARTREDSTWATFTGPHGHGLDIPDGPKAMSADGWELIDIHTATTPTGTERGGYYVTTYFWWKRRVWTSSGEPVIHADDEKETSA